MSDRELDLPELPTEAFVQYEGCSPMFTADQMRAYALAERERCAQVCEATAKGTGPDGEPNCVWESAYKHVTDECAAAIRKG